MYEFSTTSYLRKLFYLIQLAAHLPLLLMVLWVIGLMACQPLCALPLIPFIFFLAHGRRKENFHFRTWVGLFCIAEFGFFYLLPGPSAEQWKDTEQRVPTITLQDGAVLHIANIRDVLYRNANDYDVRYLEEDFPLQEVVGVSLAEQFRGDGSEDSKLMLSFEFQDGRYLVFSPELRLPKGKELNSFRAYYKNYGLVYLFGTEEDFFLSSTDLRHGRIYLYPLAATPRQSAEMLMLCVGLAEETNSRSAAYLPMQENYRSGILSVLRHFCPELPARRPMANNDIARQLYLHRALRCQLSGDWNLVRRRFAVGNDISKDDRSAYSDKLRRRIGAETRTAIPERKLQETPTAPDSVTEETPRRAPRLTAADIPEPGARLQQDAHPARHSAADIPEPGVRLQQDIRPAAEETSNETAQTAQPGESHPTDKGEEPQGSEETKDIATATRELDKQEQIIDLPKKTIADSILEPGARMNADDRKEEEADAEIEASRKRAAEGHDIMDDGKKQDSESRFSELFFGKKSSGITIIEKAKPKEEPHPLDPHRKQKRKNPFNDEEQQQKEPTEPQEKDPFAKPAPIRI